MNTSPKHPQAETARRFLAGEARWSAVEIAFWVAAFAVALVGRSHHLLFAEIAILALFAMSLDLILGYAGIEIGRAHV